MSLSLNESEEKSGPFVVHWLNNKELHFTLSMEVFLQQFKRNFEHISSEASTEEPDQMTFRSDEGKMDIFIFSHCFPAAWNNESILVHWPF